MYRLLIEMLVTLALNVLAEILIRAWDALKTMPWLQ